MERVARTSRRCARACACERVRACVAVRAFLRARAFPVSWPCAAAGRAANQSKATAASLCAQRRGAVVRPHPAQRSQAKHTARG